MSVESCEISGDDGVCMTPHVHCCIGGVAFGEITENLMFKTTVHLMS